MDTNNSGPNPDERHVSHSDKPNDPAHFISAPRSLEAFLVPPIPWWKRGIDLAGASIALILMAPLFLIITILIKIISPGPAFFKQERTGYLGKPFTIWKFRTMHVNAESTVHEEHCRNSILNDLELKKVENDSRIFPMTHVPFFFIQLPKL